MKLFLFSLFLSIFHLSCLSDSRNTINNPVFERTDIPAFRINKVEITKDTTYLYCSFSAQPESWANMSKGTYLLCHDTQKKYKIIKSLGLPFGPEKRHFINDELCEVVLFFPSIKGSKKFDIIETPNEKGFNIFGVDLNDYYEKEFRESDFNRFTNIASFYDTANDTLKAIQYKKEENEAAKFIFGKESDQFILSLLTMSFLYDKYGFHDDAINNMIRFLDLFGKVVGTNNWDFASHLNSLAYFYEHAKKYEMSIRTFKESIKICEELHICNNEYALALRTVAYNYSIVGDRTNELTFWGKSIEARKTIGDKEQYINELYNSLLDFHGDNLYGLECISLVKRELENLPIYVDSTDVELFVIHKQIAILYSMWEMKRFEDAIIHCDKALYLLRINKRMQNEDYAVILSLKTRCLGFVAIKTQSWDEAINTGEYAKKLFESLDPPSPKYAEHLCELANLYFHIYNLEKAIQLQLTACNFYERDQDRLAFRDRLTLANTYNDIGKSYNRLEMLDSAQFFTQKAIDVSNTLEDIEVFLAEEGKRIGSNLINNSELRNVIKDEINLTKSNSYETLANIYQKLGNMEKTIDMEKERGKILQHISDKQFYAIHLMILGDYYRKFGQLSKAIVCETDALTILKNYGSTDLAARVQVLLAYAYYDNGDIEQAIKNAKESIYLSESVNNKLFKALGHTNLAIFYTGSQKYEKAENHMSEGLSFIQDYIRSGIKDMTSEQRQRLWDVYEIYFISYRKIIGKSRKTEEQLSKLFNYLLFSKSLLLDTFTGDYYDDLSKLDITWKEIQQRLTDKDIAIEFFTTPDDKDEYLFTYNALIIDKFCQYPRMITLYNESDLEKILQTSDREILDIVGELIWKPILGNYSQATNIYFSPDFILHRLPIEHYFSKSILNVEEKYNVYRLSSTKEIIRNNKSNIHDKAILYGGLDYNEFTKSTTNININKDSSLIRGIAERGGFEPLYNTLSEIQSIDKLLKNNRISTIIYSREKGTEESFKMLSGKGISIIHLATHGMYVVPEGVNVQKQENNFDFLESLTNEKNPVREDVTLTHSFLVMAGGNKLIRRDVVSDENNDGILTAKEISQLDLSGLDLVVLSACESALGDINSGGIYGLQRGFKKAGANTILMSLSKVDDEATRLLMVEFYKNLMGGKSKLQSLKDAQNFLRQVENGKYDNPEYWASFIMLDGLN